VCKRDKSHLFKIDLAYRQKHKISLIELIESECSGDIRKLLKYIVMPEIVYDTYMLKKACGSIGTNEALLIEVLASRPGSRMLKVRERFEKENKPLVDLIRSETSGVLQTMGLRLLQGRPDTPADEAVAEQRAADLHEAGVGCWGTKEGKFFEIIGNSSTAQCAAIRKVYESKYQTALETSIRSEFSGDLRDALLALLLSPVDYHAVQLHAALSGFFVDESVVCRALGGNDKPTVKLIAEKYFDRYNEHLVDVIKKRLSDELQEGAVAWISCDAFSS